MFEDVLSHYSVRTLLQFAANVTAVKKRAWSNADSCGQKVLLFYQTVLMKTSTQKNVMRVTL
jgi:hypothetical protein